MASILIKTFGCTANQDNEAIMAGLLLESGHSLVKDDVDADIIVVNSCVVKSATENRIFQLLKDLKDKKIIITGCMPGAQPNRLKKIAPNASLLSTQHTTDIVYAVEKMLKGEIITLNSKRKENKAFVSKLRPKEIATIQIGEGCADICYFCQTKLAKGHIFSFPVEDIKKEVEHVVKNGYKIIYLTSQDNGAYGLDKNKISQLANLLKELIKVEGKYEIRVGMTNPRHIIPIIDDLVKVYKNDKIKKFLHIPVQSGSNKVLKEMNRKHSVDDFLVLVDKFRKEFEDFNIATDIIVGYPTENEEDFNDTIELIKKIKPEVINISKFTPRPLTKASKMKQLKSEIIKDRSKKLADVYEEIKKELKTFQSKESLIQISVD